MRRKNLRDMTEPELRREFNAIGAMLEEVMPAGPARGGAAMFVLLVFDDPGVSQYVSNCDRWNMVTALREAADRLEKQEDIKR